MKKKELKELAKKIARYERIIQETTDETEKTKAENAIINLSGSVHSLEDMMAIDELVQDIMQQVP